MSDAVLSGQLYSLWEADRKVYGVRKIWKAARRAGLSVGRDHTARLMRFLGIEGVKRSKRVKTTTPDPTAVRHQDLVKRDFTATAPKQLWVTDLTFVPTWGGRGIREFHHRRLLQKRRRLAGRNTHENSNRSQRNRDGEMV